LDKHMLQVSVFSILKRCFPAKLFKINVKYCFRVKICVLKFGFRQWSDKCGGNWGVFVVFLVGQVSDFCHLGIVKCCYLFLTSFSIL
jgi:hypothetical protein